MVMYANEFKTKEKQKLTATYIMIKKKLIKVTGTRRRCFESQLRPVHKNVVHFFL